MPHLKNKPIEHKLKDVKGSAIMIKNKNKSMSSAIMINNKSMNILKQKQNIK